MGLMVKGRNAWRIERAGRFALVVDASDYFVAAREAMLKARQSILLIAWDFDARIPFGKADDGGPERLGDFILWLADRTPGLQIRLLRWGAGAIRSMFRGSTLWTVLRWRAHPQITLRFDRKHPFASSHHQKIIAIDDSIAFCGGIDMTSERWDRPTHFDRDPRRVSPGGRQHPPWHDAASLFDGPAARAIGDLGRDRWKLATGKDLPRCDAGHDAWPPCVTPDLRDISLAIARTRPKMPDAPPIHEIEQADIDLIRAARQSIYAESQYFASRRIAQAIAERLMEADGPDIVIINPKSAKGWLEPLAMDTARARLMEALRRLDRHGRLRIYHPRTAGGAWIYVHSKLMIVDGRVLRVGSSNFNNRSLRLDTECDIVIEGDKATAPVIAGLRDRLLAEHLGCTPAEVAARLSDTGGLIAAIEGLKGEGRSLVPYEIPTLSGIEEWLAENEILDPNGPDDLFESPARRGLFKGWDRLRARVRVRGRLAALKRYDARRRAQRRTRGK